MMQVRRMPDMPPIGRPETYYAREVHRADKVGDLHAHEANKVGQYITLGIDPALPWCRKVRYFDHALKRHCNPPPLPDEDVWLFYSQLADLVRTHAGEQALRLACKEDERFAAQLAAGRTRESICADARNFFSEITTLSTHKPSYFNEEDWQQLRMLRDEWCG